MQVLVHVCCGPCLVHPLAALREEGFEVRGFFYNPNIQPYSEFSKRLDSLQRYAQDIDLPLIVRPDYPLEDWLRAVSFRETERCSYCYHARLSAAARLAKKSGFEAYTTTLLYSKLQNHELIKVIGAAAGQEAGVKFLYRDFRQGWLAGIKGSQAAGLYRQQYCGCIYSERDRYLGRPGRKKSGPAKNRGWPGQEHKPPRPED